jgi:hypothetical protein
MTDLLRITLDGWILGDGNYAGFERGRDYRFALEFWPIAELRLRDAEPTPIPALYWLKDWTYRVAGTVIHAKDDWWVLDVGLRVFRDTRPPWPVGTRVWGEIGLGIDPFYYFENRAHEPDAPALIYDWVVEAIDPDTTPFIEVSPRRFRRDRSRPAFRPIEKTDPQSDYILTCRRLPGQPRR